VDELSEDQKGLISIAILHGEFEPRPEYLPDCHKLYERGWFDLRVTDDAVVFSLSQSGYTTLELGVPLGDAKAAMN
jgi:hypothetical protein